MLLFYISHYLRTSVTFLLKFNKLLFSFTPEKYKIANIDLHILFKIIMDTVNLYGTTGIIS